jgi:hypothetical protein
MTDNPQTIRGLPLKKVGVIIVHGIGEQKRFEFLEGETRKIVDAIVAKYAKEQRHAVTATLTTASSDTFLGAHCSWSAGPEAPLHVLVEVEGREIVDIAFHEVWWADINETLTIGKQVRFWAWGLALPGIAAYHNQVISQTKERMRLPAQSGILPWRNRLRMALVSMLFGFSAFSIALVNMVLKRLDFSPLLSSDILVSYLSGVKLYSQDKRAGGSPMDGPNDPPRAAIRRRMVRVMVDVAANNYDRWYILAHSLGTIVAWNGLMEPEEALPNYLEQKRWSELKAPLRDTTTQDIDIDSMMPNRPVWLDQHDIISRDALFEKFHGILTYGSPLERFCALWSAMVPINKEEDPFREGAEWVNVYDPTDPVGTWIFDYDPEPGVPRPGHTKLKPHNFPCNASPFLLYSHLCYFRKPRPGDPHRDDYLVNQVARWLVTGKSLADEINQARQTPNPFWLQSKDDRKGTQKLVRERVIWRGIQDAIVLILLSLLTIFSLRWVIYPVIKAVLKWIDLPDAAAALTCLVDRLSPHHSALGNLAIEVLALWIVTAFAVGLASWVQYRTSTRDQKELAEYYQGTTTPPTA